MIESIVTLNHDLPQTPKTRKISEVTMGTWFSNSLIVWVKTSTGAVSVLTGVSYPNAHFEHMSYVVILDVNIRTRDAVENKL